MDSMSYSGRSKTRKNDGEDPPIMLSTKTKSSDLYNKVINQPISYPSPNIVHISNITAPDLPLTEQISSILNQLTTRLTHENLSSSSIVFTTILLRSMISFPIINAIYTKSFDSAPLPPARVTVACGDAMPEGADVLLSIVADRTLEQSSKNGAQPMTLAANPIRKQGLHIQSRSYWCPANIGPYSQAILSPSTSKMYIAGQIPLIPSTMEVYNPFFPASLESNPATPAKNNELERADLKNFHAQACLSLQHLWRIGREKRVGWWEGVVVYIASSTLSDSHASDHQDEEHALESKARIASHLWKQLHDPNFWNPQTLLSNKHREGINNIRAVDVDDDDDSEQEEDEDFDIWHRTYNANFRSTTTSTFLPTSFSSSSSPDSQLLPDFDFQPHQKQDAKSSLNMAQAVSSPPLPSSPPPFLAIQVTELPMGVGVEWQAVGLTRHAAAGAEEEEHHHQKEEAKQGNNDDKAADNNAKEETHEQSTPTTTPEWITHIASHPCFRYKVLLY